MSKKQKLPSSIIIDIGTASVGAALMSRGALGTPVLSRVHRTPIGTGSETSRQALLQTAENALKTLLQEYATTVVKDVRVVVAAPWHEAHIRTLTAKTDHLAAISEKTLTRAVTRYQSEKPPQSGNVDVEAVAIHVLVNGYGTSLSRAVNGTRIDINLYESEMSRDIQKRFWSRIESVFPNAEISFHTFPLISLVALRALIADTSFMIVDIAGEMTELSVLFNDTLRHIASFPIGYQTIARAMSPDPETIGDTMSRLTLWSRGELAEDEQSKVSSAFAKAFSKWHEAFDEVLRSVSEHSPIPHALYLLGDKEPLGWFKRGLSENNTFGTEAVPVEPSMFQTSLQIAEGGSYDIFLSLAALFFRTQKTDLIGEERGNVVVYPVR